MDKKIFVSITFMLCLALAYPTSAINILFDEDLNFYFGLKDTGDTFNYNITQNITNNITQELTSTTYLVNNISTISGTHDDGNETSTQVFKDGQSYNVSEANGPNPLTIIANFTNVTDFNTIVMRTWYEGGQGHEIEVGLFDWTGNVYEEEYIDITDQTGFKTVSVFVYDAADHISGTNVSLRFRHVQNGNPNHNFYIDYLVLVDGVTEATTSQHDGLGGRDDIENHPWALPIDGTRNATVPLYIDIIGDLTGEMFSPTGQGLQWENNYYGRFTADYANLSFDISTSNTGSYALWIYLNTLTQPDTYNMLIATQEGPHNVDNYMRFGVSLDGTLDTLTYDTGVTMLCKTSPGAITAGNWHHAGLTQNGSGYTIYVNGEPQAFTCSTGSPTTTEWWDDVCPANTMWSIGGMFYGPSAPSFGEINGKLDDVMIFERALSHAEYADLYIKGRNRGTTDPTDLVAFYKLNNNLIDETGSFDIVGQDGMTFLHEESLHTNATTFEVDDINTDTGTIDDLTSVEVIITTNITLHEATLHGTLSPSTPIKLFSDGSSWITSSDIIPNTNKSLNLGSPNKAYAKCYCDNLYYSSPIFMDDTKDIFKNIEAKPNTISEGWGQADITTYPEGCYEEMCYDETYIINKPCPAPLFGICEEEFVREVCTPKLNVIKCLAITMKLGKDQAEIIDSHEERIRLIEERIK